MRVAVCQVDGTGKNIFVRLLNRDGVLVAQASAGLVGLKGPKKRTGYAAELTGLRIAEKGLMMRMRGVKVLIRGSLSKGVKGAILGLRRGGLRIHSLTYSPVIAHNGVRLRKSRRK